MKSGISLILLWIVHGSFYFTRDVIKRYPRNGKCKTPCSWFQWKSLETFISITNDGIFTKKISRVIEPIWKLWWKFHRNSFVSYGDKIFQTFSLKSWTGSFEGCEIRNFINLALYCPWIILFYKGCYQTLSQKSKMQNSLFVISMKKFGNFYLHN